MDSEFSDDNEEVDENKNEVEIEKELDINNNVECDNEVFSANEKRLKPRGPKPAICWKIMLEICKGFDVLDEKNQVKPVTKFMKMYKAISKKLGNKISAKSLQTYLAQDRHNLKTDLITHKNTPKTEKPQDNESEKTQVVVQVSSINMMNVLLRMQSDALYKPIIKLFCPYPFTLHYWSIQAVELTQFVPYNMVYVFGSIGNLTQEFCIPNEYISNKLNSYCLGWTLENDFIPLLQMISEGCEYNIFKRLFNEALRLDFFAPSKVVIEYLSYAYTATVECFNLNYTVPKYVSTCFESLMCNQNNVTQLPDCQIFAEIGGIIAIVNSWKYSSNIEEDLKLFFGNVFILLGNSETLDDFKSDLTKVLVLSLSKFESELTEDYYDNLSSRIDFLDKQANYYNSSRTSDLLIHKPQISSKDCPNVYGFLLNMLDVAKLMIEHYNKLSTEISLLKENIQNVDASNYKQLLSTESQLILVSYPELDRVLLSSLSKSESILKEEKSSVSILNAFYSDDIANSILDICIDFVTWTKIMNSKFNLKDDKSTTCSLNNYRDEFSSSCRPDEFPMKIDEYLQHNIEFTERKIQVGLSKFEHKVQKKKVSKFSFQKEHENWFNIVQISSEESDSCSEAESYIEEWEDSSLVHEDYLDKVIIKNDSQDNNTMPKKKRKLGILTEPCPEFFLRAQQPKKKNRKRSIIKNANLMKDLKVDKELVLLLTTSPLDSIVEVLVSSYYAVSKFQKFLDTTLASNAAMQMIKAYVSNLQLKSLYAKRTELLSNIFTEKLDNKLYWNASEACLIGKIISPSIKETTECLHCNFISTELVSCTKIASKTVATASDITESLILSSPRFCSRCGNEAQVTCNVENYLFCDIECKDTEKEVLHNLYDLPEELIIKSKTFVLIGAVAFQHGFLKYHIKHYIAFCRNFQKKWTMYDDMTSRKELVGPENATMELAILVYIEYEAVNLKGEKEFDGTLLEYKETAEDMLKDTNDDQINTEKVTTEKHEGLDCDGSSSSVLEDNTLLTKGILDDRQVKDMSTEQENNFFDKETTIIEVISLLDSADESIPIVPNEKDLCINLCDNKRYSLGMTSGSKFTLFTSTPNAKQSIADRKISIPTFDNEQLTFKRTENAEVDFSQPMEKVNGRILIRNGARQQGHLIFKFERVEYKIKFIYTCAIDSLFEILTDLCMESSPFQQDIVKKKQRNALLNTIYNYCFQNFDVGSLYKYRAKESFIRPYSIKPSKAKLTRIIEYNDNVLEIYKDLTDLAKEEKDYLEVDSRTNVVSLFNTLMASVPSIIESTLCTNVKCKKEVRREKYALSVDTILFFTYGVKYLEMMVQEALNNKNRFCSYCKITNVKTVKVVYHIQNYLAIDLESFFEISNEARLSKSTGRTVHNVHVNLNALQDKIVLNYKHFVLKAAIEFTDVPGALNHYIAYSKLGSKWFKYDDMLQEREELIGTSPSIKIALLFYIAK